MTETCTESLNKYLQPSVDVKKKLLSLIASNDQQILKLKHLIYAKDSPDSFASFLSHGPQLVKKIDDVQQQFNKLEPKVVSCIESGKQLANQLIPNIIEMRSLNTSFEVAEREELISRYRSEVDAALVLGAFEMSLSSFSNLSIHLGTHFSSPHPPPATLPTFYCNMLDFFCRKFQETLQRMDIPRIKPPINWLEDGIGRLSDRCPWDEETLRTFCCQYKALSSIKLPERVADTDAAKRARLSIPMRLILEPLEKRFLFNFYGTQLTNKPEKPEWYFTEVLTWISINDQWLTWMQDEQLKDVEFSSTLRVEFMQGLISFVVDKISYDLGLLSAPPKPRCAICLQENGVQETTETDGKNRLLTSPPAFFGHLTDEMLAFESRLDGLYYHPNALRPADLFTHRIDVLQHWLFLESEAAHSKVKELLAKPYAWNMDNKVPQCVGDFVALVYAISRRGAQLQHNAAKPRAYFFKIQLDLIFTFLEAITLLLPWNASSTPKGPRDLAGDELVGWTSIVNAMHAMVETMQDWTNDQYFVELWEDQESRSLLSCSWDPWIEDESEVKSKAAIGWKTISQRLNSALEETAPLQETKIIADSRLHCPGVFSEISELYRRKIDQCLQKVSQSVFAHLQKLAQDYLSDGQHWSQVSSDDEERHVGGSSVAPLPPSGLSGRATELFVQLSHNLFATSKYLHSRLFVRLWHPTLQHLNQFLYKNLILSNRFTQTGASQLKYDLEHCLRALLAPYSTLLPIDDLLAECFDACRLLTLPSGSLCLLKQALRGEDLTATVLGPLVELGIRRLTPEDALDVISRYISPSGAF